MHTFTMTVGDWSCDGHNKSKDFNIECNYSLDDVKKAYQKISEEIKLDVINNCFSEYEENTLSFEHAKILKKAGINLENILDDYTEDENEESAGFMFSDNFVDLILAIVKLELKNLTFKVIKNKNVWHCGGYGLFYN